MLSRMDKIRALAAELVEEVAKTGLTPDDFDSDISDLVCRTHLLPYKGIPAHQAPAGVIAKAVLMNEKIRADFGEYFMHILREADDAYLNVAEKLVDTIRLKKVPKDDPQRKVSEDF